MAIDLILIPVLRLLETPGFYAEVGPPIALSNRRCIAYVELNKWRRKRRERERRERRGKKERREETEKERKGDGKREKKSRGEREEPALYGEKGLVRDWSGKTDERRWR
ncbi:hypothetical protein TNCV_3140211 [Trichonephila clavipes]|nr:hypothetical protein TNCV_3140211 [Trichonephila clavipes]